MTAERLDPPVIDEHAIDESALWSITGYALRRTDHVLQRDFRRHIGKPLGISEIEFSLVMLAGANPETTQKALCASLGMKPPALAVVLDRLEKAGIVERRRMPEDRRVQIVALSTRGASLYEQARTRAREMESRIRQRLDASERATLAALLRKLRVN